MSLRSKIVKMLLGDAVREEMEKSSRQVISHAGEISPSEGILPEIDFDVFQTMYEQTSWVRAVVGVICKAVTARGYTLTPVKPNADPRNAETLQEFFSNCNPNDTLVEILDDITRDVYVFGNAFIELVYGPDGRPREIWNLDATGMRVQADEHGAILGYVQSPRFSRSQQGKVGFAPRDVLHFKLGTKGATLYGLSPLASLLLPVTVDKFAQVYNRAFFVNGAKIRGAFIMKDATPEQVERNRAYLNARVKNPELAHADLVLEGDIEFRQVGVNQKDMEFLQLREFTRNEILAVYGVPPGKVSIIETGNIGAGTGDHQTQTFYEETILPFQLRVAEKINKHIIRQGFGITDWAFQFNKRAIDEKDQAEIFGIYLQNGVFTAEEVRRLVAPRMPEIQKSLGQGDTIANATREVVAIENRFTDAMGRLFRGIKNAVKAKLPELDVKSVLPKAAALNPPFTAAYNACGRLAFRLAALPETAKRLDDIEVLLKEVDSDQIARVIERFTLEAARKGMELSARRAAAGDIDDLSQSLREKLKANAALLAGHVSESIRSVIRQALIEGIAASETIPQLMARIDDQLDSVAAINIKPVLDADGNIVRAGGTRRLGRADASEIIARTEANRAYNEGNLDALRQSEIERVQWLLSADACAECVAAAEASSGDNLGRVTTIDEASDVLPVHPNCRCTWVSVLEEK